MTDWCHLTGLPWPPPSEGEQTRNEVMNDEYEQEYYEMLSGIEQPATHYCAWNLHEWHSVTLLTTVKEECKHCGIDKKKFKAQVNSGSPLDEEQIK